ncbi:hypothetical protein JK358_35410 [Nocardia sp. 2]|uniref:AB hydrolase-1 domain-containing protein n=1 Tax=Nocardia acididurans TaxID=2802282 RepID=A0ABS1MGN9_9NOCA|nr:hypothetical protein [Nocardia acididurans]MBL1079706.1 hypothetical protein [Nocardia acididurans]
MPQRSEDVRYTLGDVQISTVTWRSPAAVTDAPAACDTLGYQRYRPLDAAGRPVTADLVLSLQPGNTGGPSSFDPLARNLIAALRRSGVNCEVWAMARRGQPLTDPTGMRAAVAAGDHRVAVDYYYRGRALGGRTYTGWLPMRRQRFLRDYGLAQVLRDWHTIHSLELPDPAQRARQLVIGGHSLGGPLSNFYCQWDFPSGPGYREVAGVIGLDGPITVDPLQLDLRAAHRTRTALRMLAATTHNRLAPPSNNVGPLRLGDLALLLSTAALAARFHPQAHSTLLADVPRSMLVDSLFRLLYPQGGPRRWQLTNAALFGTLFSRSAAATTLANDMGTYQGAVRVKRAGLTRLARTPLAGEIVTAAFGGGPLHMPADPRRTLTDWCADGGISSFTDTVFAWGNGEFSYLNSYESRRLVGEAFAGMIGERSGDLTGLRHGDWEEHIPSLTITGDVWTPIRRRLHPRANLIHAEGYSHQDVLSARQPDVVVDSMTAFLLGNLEIARSA